MEKLNDLIEQGADITPYFHRLNTELFAVDVRKSYTSAKLRYFTHKLQIPIPNVCDNIEEYDGEDIKCCFYYVANFVAEIKNQRLLPFPPMYLPHFEVQILMDKYGLKKENIFYQLIPRQSFSVVFWACVVPTTAVEATGYYFKSDDCLCCSM